MRFKMTPIKIAAALILGIAAFGFSLSAIRTATHRYEMQSASPPCFAGQTTSMPGASLDFLSAKTTSEPLVRLFQLMFILFFISPPIIALMLFLIWRELKKRNEMK